MGMMDIDNTIREVIKGGKEAGMGFGGGFKFNQSNIPKPNIPRPESTSRPSDNDMIYVIKQALSSIPHIENAYGEVTIKLQGTEPKRLSFKLQ